MRRPGVGLAFAAVVALAVLAPPAAAAKREFRGGCWYGAERGVTPAAWPFTADGSAPSARRSPRCRVTVGGLKDRTAKGTIEHGKEVRALHRKWIDKPLPLTDSLGIPFATIVYKGRDRWTIQGAGDPQPTALAGRAAFLVKGRVCTSRSPQSPIPRKAFKRYVHVRFGPREGSDKTLGIGGLIDRRVFRGSARVVRANAGCGKRWRARAAEPARPIGEFMGLAGHTPAYVSKSGGPRGESLDNYFSARFGVAALSTSTTGVDGGGLAVAIVRADTPFKRTDGFGYADRNNGCDSTEAVTWSYGKVALGRRDVWGWVPQFTALPAPFHACPPGTPPA